MPTYVTQQIRVYPVVKKFLSFYYDTDPFVVGAGGNVFSSYLNACLDRYPKKDAPRTYERLTSTLLVGVTPWEARHGFGSQLSPQKIVAFNEFVRSSFLEKLVVETQIRASVGGDILGTIATILERYQLSEEDLPLMSTHRYFYRYHRRTGLTRPFERSVGVIQPGLRVA